MFLIVVIFLCETCIFSMWLTLSLTNHNFQCLSSWATFVKWFTKMETLNFMFSLVSWFWLTKSLILVNCQLCHTTFILLEVVSSRNWDYDTEVKHREFMYIMTWRNSVLYAIIKTHIWNFNYNRSPNNKYSWERKKIT